MKFSEEYIAWRKALLAQEVSEENVAEYRKLLANDCAVRQEIFDKTVTEDSDVIKLIMNVKAGVNVSGLILAGINADAAVAEYNDSLDAANTAKDVLDKACQN